MALWTLISLVSIIALPQLLGVLLYFRLIRFSKWLAFALAVLVPGILFFFVAHPFFFAGLREAAQRGELGGCGLPALAATFMLLFGTVAQFILALIVQLSLLVKRRAVS